MAAEFSKLFNGCRISIGESIVYSYLFTGIDDSPTGDDTSLIDYIVANIPKVEQNIQLSAITVDEQINNTTWKVTAEYKTDKKSFPNQLSRTFDTSGSTVHKSISLERLYDSLEPANEGKEGLAVGFNGEDVEGVDIGVAGFIFTEVHPIPDAAITIEYEKALSKASWHVNDSPFRGYAAGEVLFKGTNGSKNGNEKYLLTFNFEVIHNEENVQVNDIVVPSKLGWDYLSVRFEKQLSDDQAKLIIVPAGVTVDRVYPLADFATLGIGIEDWRTTVQKSTNDVENLLLSFPFGQ